MATEKLNKEKELVGKVFSDEADSRELHELSEMPFMDRRMRAQWEAGNRMPADAGLGQRMWQQIEKKTCGTGNNPRIRRRLYMSWVLAAACVAVLVVIGTFWLRSNVETVAVPQLVEVLAQTDRQVLLSDSSQVWMKPGSRLCYHTDFMADRRVWLDGEAVFDVQKHAGSNFKVFLNDDYIEVKGTVFRVVNLEQLPCEVDLFEGKVEFNAVAAGRKVTMKPHQHLLFMPGKDVLELKDADPVEWDNGKYRFRSIKASDLVRVIGHIYHTQIVLDNEEVAGELFNGAIRTDESLEEVLDKLCYNLGLSCKYEAGSYRLH